MDPNVLAILLIVTVPLMIGFTMLAFLRAVGRLQDGADRLEAQLDRMEGATVVVADNLADSVSRADATIGPDGAAADAALRTGDTPEAITKRQNAAP